MATKPEYSQTLDALAAFIRSREATTARDVSEHFRCCRPSAYQRLRALKKKLGRQMFTVALTPGKSTTGPVSKAYGIRP